MHGVFISSLLTLAHTDIKITYVKLTFQVCSQKHECFVEVVNRLSYLMFLVNQELCDFFLKKSLFCYIFSTFIALSGTSLCRSKCFKEFQIKFL